MKVLQIVSSFAPAYSYGGPPRSSYQISKNLAANGHDVHVFTTDVYDSSQRYDPEIHPLPTNNLNISRFHTISNTLAYKVRFNFAPGMARNFATSIDSFDIVHIEEFRTPQAALAWRYATKANIPYVLQTRGGVPRTLKSKQKWVFDKIIGERLFRDAARIIATSHSESGRYFEVFPDTDPEKIAHIPNGVDLEKYRDPPELGGFRDEHAIDPDSPVVLFVGRLDEMKGVDLLINAFKSVIDAVPEAELYIVGPDDGQRNDLESQTEVLGLTDAIHFLGPLYDREKLQAYVDADVFVLPSKYRYESFGNVVIEAMACETAVVLTEKCGASEWIPAEAGRTVGASAEEISAGIVEILSDTGLRSSMADSGRELVLERFNWSTISEMIEDIYVEIFQERN